MGPVTDILSTKHLPVFTSFSIITSFSDVNLPLAWLFHRQGVLYAGGIFGRGKIIHSMTIIKSCKVLHDSFDHVVLNDVAFLRLLWPNTSLCNLLCLIRLVRVKVLIVTDSLDNCNLIY